MHKAFPISKMPGTLHCFHKIKVSKYLRVKCVFQMHLTVSNQNELQALLYTGRQTGTLPGWGVQILIFLKSSLLLSLPFRTLGYISHLIRSILWVLPWKKATGYPSVHFKPRYKPCSLSVSCLPSSQLGHWTWSTVSLLIL